MTGQHRATTEQWEVVAICREEGKIPWVTATALLELRARVEALEAANQSWNKKVSKLAGVAKDVSANLEAQQRSAVKESLTTQPGGLVEMVADGLGICESLHCGDPPEDWNTEARAAIRAVAAWLRTGRLLHAAILLEQEVDRG